jgi:DNA-directed RNA polymerase subunit RPC12/RpoP
MKKDIFRPYCLEDPVTVKFERSQSPPTVESFYSAYTANYLKYRNIEDINTAHAILDLSRSSSSHQKSGKSLHSGHGDEEDDDADSSTPTPLLSPALSTNSSHDASKSSDTYKINEGKTTAYTYEAFFASDGRSRKKQTVGIEPQQQKARYTCSECGKHYATSSNLSRHKQTHRSLDSGSAKKCHVCDKMYVSMPALSMHILTHNLSHRCDVCGKSFSRPWLLQGHMRSHSGDKPYGCAHCGKCFADRSNLRAHMQTHSAFKNFKCKRCNKSFALKSYLNKHYESACFKDQPIPSIDTPPCTPAPSDFSSGSDGMVSPGARSSSSSSGSHHELSHHFSNSGPSIASLLSVLPSALHSPPELRAPNSILGV